MLLKAIEEKRFLPVGADVEATSDFELIAGTHRDLRQMVAAGTFREDLYARINLWTYELPGLAERREDIEPNLEFELDRFGREQGEQVRFNVEAKRRYLAFATSPRAAWAGNFRELSASVTRMATLADAGRITEALAEQEVERLTRTWSSPGGAGAPDACVDAVFGARAEELDLFDRAQLERVLDVCRMSASLSEAGRTLFAVSRQSKKQPNDADRLRKYLARFGLDWDGCGRRSTERDAYGGASAACSWSARHAVIEREGLRRRCLVKRREECPLRLRSRHIRGARECVCRQPRIAERRMQCIELHRLRIVDRIHPVDMNMQRGNPRGVFAFAVARELPAVRAMPDPQRAIVFLPHHDEPRHPAGTL